MKILAALIFISASACAQTAPSPTPLQGPLLNRAPVSSQWTIASKLEATGADGGGSASRDNGESANLTAVIKEQNFVFETIANAHGCVVETWYIPGGAVVGAGGKSWHFLAGPENNFDSTDYYSSDFAGFDWISTANFAGMKDVQGRHCLVFTDKVLTMDPKEIAVIESSQSIEYGNQLESWKLARAATGQHPKSDSPAPVRPVFDTDQHKVQAVAYIDDRSRLPVMLTYGVGGATMVRTYQFQPAQGSLTIPPEVQQILDSHKARQLRQSKPIAPI